VVDQRVGAPGEVLAVDAVCKTRQGGSTRPVLRGLQGGPLHAELQPGGVPETLGIIASRRPRGALVDTLGQEVSEGVIDRGLRSLVLHGSGKAFGETHLAVDATQQEGAKVGGEGPPLKIGPYSIASEGRKTSLFGRRIGHTQTACGFDGMDASSTPFYQRLTRGLCFFMKNSG
jgi:hypothetical protein